MRRISTSLIAYYLSVFQTHKHLIQDTDLGTSCREIILRSLHNDKEYKSLLSLVTSFFLFPLMPLIIFPSSTHPKVWVDDGKLIGNKKAGEKGKNKQMF